MKLLYITFHLKQLSSTGALRGASESTGGDIIIIIKPIIIIIIYL